MSHHPWCDYQDMPLPCFQCERLEAKYPDCDLTDALKARDEFIRVRGTMIDGSEL